jgi:hypothetical protein
MLKHMKSKTEMPPTPAYQIFTNNRFPAYLVTKHYVAHV